MLAISTITSDPSRVRRFDTSVCNADEDDSACVLVVAVLGGLGIECRRSGTMGCHLEGTDKRLLRVIRHDLSTNAMEGTNSCIHHEESGSVAKETATDRHCAGNSLTLRGFGDERWPCPDIVRCIVDVDQSVPWKRRRHRRLQQAAALRLLRALRTCSSERCHYGRKDLTRRKKKCFAWESACLKAIIMSGSDTEERPSKRPKMDTPVDDLDDDDEEEQLVEAPVRASDLYLDTVLSHLSSCN